MIFQTTRKQNILLASALLFVATSDVNTVSAFTTPKTISKVVHSKSRIESRLQNELDIRGGAEPESSTSKAKQSFFSKFGGKGNKEKLTKASTAGLAVSLAMVPEAVAFAFVAGVSPLVGLWTTVVLGFFAAALGRPGGCSSASGACSVVVAALCASHGPAYLSLCALMAGLFQTVGGALGLGKFILLVPHAAMLGFVNGLGKYSCMYTIS
jgi:hypothetical protein